VEIISEVLSRARGFAVILMFHEFADKNLDFVIKSLMAECFSKTLWM